MYSLEVNKTQLSNAIWLTSLVLDSIQVLANVILAN